jgi:hypothetical protein
VLGFMIQKHFRIGFSSSTSSLLHQIMIEASLWNFG